MAYRPPKHCALTFAAQIGKETDEERYRQKLETMDRKVNEAFHESIKDGFVMEPLLAITPTGDVVVFMKTDPRPIPGTESKIATPNLVPGILAPPVG